MIWAQHTAVVLRRYQHSFHKYALLDQTLGRIEAIVYTIDSLTVGALINYSIKKQSGSHYIIEQWETDNIPLLLAQEDLLFLHHILEVCYYFIPIGSSVQGIFPIISLLYNASIVNCNRIGKKLLLLRLLMTIGLYPEGTVVDMHYIRHLYMRSVDMKLDEALDLTGEKKLNAWLLACIMQHPQHEHFKTINFLIDDSVDRSA